MVDTAVGHLIGADAHPLHFSPRPCCWTRQVLVVFALAFVLAFGGEPLRAQAQSPRAERTLDLQITQNTTFEVRGTPEISIPELGQAVETPAGTATYALTTNTGKPKEIQASLDEALPTGLSLEAKVDAPALRGRGATSTGWTPLSTEERRVVFDIQKAEDSGVPIAYRAAASAAVVPDTYTLTVTYTITD